MSDFQEYPDVLQEIRGAMNPGRLKLQRNSVIFKNSKTGKVDQLQSADFRKCEWLKRARGHCLKLVLKSGNVFRWDGFKESDFDRVSKFIKEFYACNLEKVDMSIKGWNWGLARFEGNALNFEMDRRLIFEVPLSNVSHTTTSKNEVTLEFHQNDDAAINLMEIRFHVPSEANNADGDPVQDFQQKVLGSADIIQATGDAIVNLLDIQCLTPRGRYDIKMYPTFLQLHGKTFDYKIPYTTILRLFLLPHKDGRQMFFVVSLDPPIKQGQTRYHFLILLFNKEDEMSVDVGMSEDDLQKKYDGKLQTEMSGSEFELVSKLFKTITSHKITVPGSFVGHSGTQAIGCSYKAATGLLYPLERGFIFVHKPPLHIRFDEVAAVNFARSAGDTRSFDLDVETKSGNLFNFVGIEKDEYGKLFDFITGKKLRVKNIGGNLNKTAVKYDEMSDSDDEKGDHDAYLERMKREGKERVEVDEDDDDDDSSDESFNPGESGSEVAEEYDSNPPTTDSSDSDYTGSGANCAEDEASNDEGAGDRHDEDKKRKKQEAGKKAKEKPAKSVPVGPRKKRNLKKKKDPNAPKRPQSAYFLWLGDHRDSIKRDNPGISVTGISKKAGEMWRQVGDKTIWEKKAKEAKSAYDVVMAEYKRRSAEHEDSESDTGKEAVKRDTGKQAVKQTNPKKQPSKSHKSPQKSTGKAESNDFKSKEFVSSDESSSGKSDEPLHKRYRTEEKEDEAVCTPAQSSEEKSGVESREAGSSSAE